MADDNITVLLIDDDPPHARLIQEAFEEDGKRLFQITTEPDFAAALERLGSEDIDVVLLHLRLPDGIGIERIDRILEAAPGASLLVLGGAHEDEEDTRQYLLHGAHDYLAKGRYVAKGLPQFVGYVVREKAARNAQKIAEKRFQAMSDVSSLGICITDTEGTCLFTNAAYHKISGLLPEQVLGNEWSRFVHPKDRQQALARWRKGIRTQASFQIEFRFQRIDRRIVWVRLKTVAMQEERPAYGYVQTMEDITEYKVREFVLRATENALFEEMELAQATLSAIGDAVVSTDIHGKVTFLNRVAEQMTGWLRKEATGLPATEVLRIIDGTTRETAENPIPHAIQEKRTSRLPVGSLLVHRDASKRMIAASCSPIRNADGHITGTVTILHERTDVPASAQLSQLSQISQASQTPQTIRDLAEHDLLTGLPNRLLLADRLMQSIEASQRQNKPLALLCIDIDYFQHINDALGHPIGDQLLQSVANRLMAGVRRMDTVCRRREDEFVVLLPDIGAAQDASHVAEKLLASAAEPHLIDAHVLHLTLSIGISIYPDDGNDATTIIQNAENAMHHAKTAGRNGFRFYQPEMNSRATQRMALEKGLRRALKNGEFVLHYQPKINLASGQITGAEALLRWQDPENTETGLRYPAQFMQIAEASGLILPIGQWVLREACRQVRRWLEAGLGAVPVSINVSATEFESGEFVDALERILHDTGVEPRYLQLELTENTLMRHTEASAARLGRLHAMGLSLTVDDFGTGYSNLSELQRFPIDTMKIDRSFVSGIATEWGSAPVVSAALALGRNLNRQVVAGGVETDEQFSALCAQHCAEGQGFHFSPPLPADAFALLLAAAP